MLGGSPHSEISGSKSGCRLPEAYRRLQRLSSPLTAKPAYDIVVRTRDLLVPVSTPVAGLTLPAYHLVVSEGSSVCAFPRRRDILS